MDLLLEGTISHLFFGRRGTPISRNSGRSPYIYVMRLWHVRLIRALPRGFLLAQHRDCCALRGRGWGKKSPHTRYVYDHSFAYLVSYHRLSIQEMVRRQWKPCLKWLNPDYRGRFADPIPEDLST